VIDPCLRRNLLVALLFGALALGGCTSDGPSEPGTDETAADTEEPETEGVSVERAEELIQGFYDGEDPSPVMDAIAPGSIDRSVAPDVAEGLSQLLRDTTTVSGSTVHVVDGVELVAVTMSDGRDWCVRPDELIIISCRVGIADVEVETRGVPVQVVAAEADVYAEQAQVRLVLRPAGEREVTFDGRIRLEGDGATFETTQAVVASRGQQIAEAGEDAVLQPGTTLLLAWATEDVDALRGQLTLSWDGGRMPVRIEEPTLFVR
jgi:hypothetical protein